MTVNEPVFMVFPFTFKTEPFTVIVANTVDLLTVISSFNVQVPEPVRFMFEYIVLPELVIEYALLDVKFIFMIELTF